MDTLEARRDYALQLQQLGVSFLSYQQSASWDDESFLECDNFYDKDKNVVSIPDDFNTDDLDMFCDLALIDINDWNDYRDSGFLDIDKYLKEVDNGSSTTTL